MELKVNVNRAYVSGAADLTSTQFKCTYLQNVLYNKSPCTLQYLYLIANGEDCI